MAEHAEINNDTNQDLVMAIRALNVAYCKIETLAREVCKYSDQLEGDKYVVDNLVDGIVSAADVVYKVFDDVLPGRLGIDPEASGGEDYNVYLKAYEDVKSRPEIV